MARIGGDEFLAIIEDCSGDEAAKAVAESLISALHDPILIEGQTLSISGSIGIAMYPANAKNAALAQAPGRSSHVSRQESGRQRDLFLVVGAGCDRESRADFVGFRLKPLINSFRLYPGSPARRTAAPRPASVA